MKSSIEVLVATMNQRDHSLVTKMNIQTDAIIANQSDTNSYESYFYEGHNIKYITYQEIGVGLNRNNALMRATSDYCILADDDITFLDGYPEKVESMFKKYKDADILIFNIQNKDKYQIKKAYKVRKINYMKFPTYRIAFRRKKLSYAGIFFNVNFGGGTDHSCGEDTIFLHDCLKLGLHIYAIPETIARINEERDSTWFKGYNKKYFFDRGVLHATLYGKLSRIINLQFLIRHIKLYKSDMSLRKASYYMTEGSKYRMEIR